MLRTLPEIGRNLEANQYQLISGYDIYMTLTHLLNYPNEYHHQRFDEVAKHEGHPLPGKSLLSEIKHHRDCEEVGVPSSSCCIGNSSQPTAINAWWKYSLSSLHSMFNIKVNSH